MEIATHWAFVIFGAFLLWLSGAASSQPDSWNSGIAGSACMVIGLLLFMQGATGFFDGLLGIHDSVMSHL